MNKDNPKRRKAKDNPYTINKEGNTYSLSFNDGQGVHQQFKIDKALYDVFDRFELEDLVVLNEFDRHTEHSELTEETLNMRALDKPKNVEEIVCEQICNKQLYAAISILPVAQKRRLLLYYFGGLTYEQIAEMEGCTKMPIKRSIDRAIEQLKEKIKSF